MKQTINSYSFRQAFKDAGRESQFSYDALGALFDYFEQYEQDTGEQIELDVVAICCEYTEEGFREIADGYSIAVEGDAEDLKDAVREYLQDNTTVVSEDRGVFVYQQF